MSRARRAWWAACALSIAASLPTSAAGQGVAAHPARGPLPDAGWAELSTIGTLSPSTRDVEAAHLAGHLALGLAVLDPVTITLDATYALTSLQVADADAYAVSRAGNPFVAVHLGAPSVGPWRGRGGLGVAAPLVTVPGTLYRNAAARLADRVALQARGGQAPWVWSDNAVPFVALLHADAALDAIELSVDVQPAYVFSVNRRASRAAIDAAASVGYRAGAFVPSLRLHGYAQSEPIEDGDFAQASAVVALRHDWDALWLRGEIALGLDGPAGFGERNATRAGLGLGVGASF